VAAAADPARARALVVQRALAAEQDAEYQSALAADTATAQVGSGRTLSHRTSGPRERWSAAQAAQVAAAPETTPEPGPDLAAAAAVAQQDDDLEAAIAMSMTEAEGATAGPPPQAAAFDRGLYRPQDPSPAGTDARALDRTRTQADALLVAAEEEALERSPSAPTAEELRRLRLARFG
jgi:hypothetical protein